jgi:hypothetical protein
LSASLHQARGTFRRDRGHALAQTEKPITAPFQEPIGRATTAERRQVLQGLQREGRRYAKAVLDHYAGLTPSDLEILRQIGQTLDRLAALQAPVLRADPGEVRRETATLIALVKALRLEDPPRPQTTPAKDATHRRFFGEPAQ